MRRVIYIISLLSLLMLVVGCRRGETETAVPTEPTISSQPAAPIETETDTEPQTVAAKPQLIEFYAHW